MSKSISQETFNEVVKENIEVFEMELLDAIVDAKKQFTVQDVNLFNIITDDSMYKIEDGVITIITHPLVIDLKKLTTQIIDNTNTLNIENLLHSLKQYFQVDIAYKLVATKHNGQEILTNVLKNLVILNNEKLINACLNTIIVYVIGQPDAVTIEFLIYLANLLRSGGITTQSMALVFRLLSSSCVKHEGNRNILLSDAINIIELSIKQLKEFGLKSRELVKEICVFIRTLILDDDIRVTFGRGTENAKAFVSETNCLDTLLVLCKEYKEKDDEMVVSEIFATLDKLSVRNEFCQRILELGGLQYMLEALNNHMKVSAIATASLGLLKSLAANDQVKSVIGKTNGLALIIRALELHCRNHSVCVNGFGALSAVTLRQIDNARVLVQYGLPQLLNQALQIHGQTKSFDVLRPVCLTVRNVVSRNPELKSDLLETGIEEHLNMVLTLGRDCDDEAKAALRDLGCKVELKELWSGKQGVKVIEEW